MFGSTLRLGRILGIPFGIDYSWFIVFVLITMSLSAEFAFQDPDWTSGQNVVFGLITSVMFFGSIVAHELGHSIVARGYGIPVKSITLFVFGGVAQIGREPEKPLQEFNIAIAGPIVSALVASAFFAIGSSPLAMWPGVATLSGWLGRINLAVAIFNLVPGFPLDGGRIFRTVVWRFTHSFERATIAATTTGSAFAYMLIVGGIIVGLRINFFSGCGWPSLAGFC